MVSYYAANGITVPLDSYFTADDLKDFMPSTVQADTYDGKLYAIAPTESSVALFYNKDYLDKAGIAYPSDTDIKGHGHGVSSLTMQRSLQQMIM